jgi:hypothetical protein
MPTKPIETITVGAKNCLNNTFNNTKYTKDCISQESILLSNDSDNISFVSCEDMLNEEMFIGNTSCFSSEDNMFNEEIFSDDISCFSCEDNMSNEEI